MKGLLNACGQVADRASASILNRHRPHDLLAVDEEPFPDQPLRGRINDGDEGLTIELLPAEEMDHVHDHYPSVGEKCSASLTPESCEEPSELSRHRSLTMPEIRPNMTEDRYYGLKCACWRKPRTEILPTVNKVGLPQPLRLLPDRLRLLKHAMVSFPSSYLAKFSPWDNLAHGLRHQHRR
jgi:hypothetical protein